MNKITKVINTATVATLLSVPVVADTTDKQSFIEITPMLGYRFGGNFDSDSSVIKLEENNSYGLLVAWPFAREQKGEVLLSHYDTNFFGSAINNSVLNNNEVSVTYLHLGGNVPINDGYFPVWVIGGFGLTHLSPQDTSLSDETRFSMNIGLNSEVALTQNLSFRVEGRVYATFFNANSQLFCASDICNLNINSEFWIQSEVSAGLTFKF